MRLYVRVGYQGLLFSNETNLGVLLEAVGKAKVVKEEGYGLEKRLVVDGDPDQSAVEVKLIDEAALCLPDIERGDVAKKLIEVVEQREKLQHKVYELERELKKLQDSISAAAALTKEKA